MDWEELRQELEFDSIRVEVDREQLNLGYGYYAYPVYAMDLMWLGFQVVETSTCYVAWDSQGTYLIPKGLLGYLLVKGLKEVYLASLDVVYPKVLSLPGIQLKLKEVLNGKGTSITG